MSIKNKYPVVVAITGASGAILAKSVIDRLLVMDVAVVTTASSAARMVWREELDESFGEALERWTDSGTFTYFTHGDLAAPIASGTYPTLGMVVVPCSMGTVAAVAHGLSDNLIHRAADVSLKERRRLVIVPRETPLSAIHLENMAKLAGLGVAVIPPMPAFYLPQKRIEDLVDFVTERILVALKLSNSLPKEMSYEGRRNGE